ncbi:MAG: DUF3842 family protein [Clostridia bacterium]|nr:DUF3842 family protein [Clostridia bacterium]
MKIVVIDGQGGRLGSSLVAALKKKNLDYPIYAIGTNSIATAAMLKSGADFGATGENPVRVACSDAEKEDVIMGPIGIVSADSLLGEITPGMAVAIGRSKGTKILIPTNCCKNIVVGIKDASLSELVNEAVEEVVSLRSSNQ